MYVIMLVDSPSTTPNLVGSFDSRADAENWANNLVPASEDYLVVYVKPSDEYGDDE